MPGFFICHMRQLTTVEEQHDAEAVGKLLAYHDIPTQVDEAPDNKGWEVWVEDDDQVQEALELWKAYQTNPQDPSIQKAIASYRESREKKDPQRHKVVDVRKSWAGPGDDALPPFLTSGLVIFCIGIYVLQNAGGNFNIDVESYLFISDRETGFLPEVLSGQLWRLVTPILMHGGLIHILFNMMWLSQLGPMIERREGTMIFGLIVLFTAVTSNISQYVWTGHQFFGMSGVVYALFGYLWIRGHHFSPPEYRLDNQTVGLMLVWLVVCYTGWVGPIANAAHTVGLLGGVLCAAILMRRIPFTPIRF